MGDMFGTQNMLVLTQGFEKCIVCTLTLLKILTVIDNSQQITILND